MQKLLLELGGPLVIAFVLLATAKFIRGLIERYKNPGATETEINGETEREPKDEPPQN